MSNLDLALIAILCGEMLGFLAFARDKRRARAGLWRTPESMLLLFGLIVLLHLILLAGGAAWVIL